jgi:hypothetical protein
MTEIPMDRDEAPTGPEGEKPKMVDVRESIRYRRRAQEAEQRCSVLEAELEQARQARGEQVHSVETALAEERRRREQMEHEYERLQRERRLERELLRAGAVDLESALLVARERLAAAGEEADVEKLARDVLAEKPHLRAAQRADVPALGKFSRGVLPRQSEGQRADRLARAARTTGRRGDLAEYMRARRTK